MSVITIFSGIFCNKEPVIQDVLKSTGYQLVTDDSIVQNAAELSGIPEEKISLAFSSRTSVFNQFTHEKERSIAYLRLAVAKLLENQNVILSGFSGLLIPKAVTHVLRICLIGNTDFRRLMAREINNTSEEASTRMILADEQDRSAWTKTLFDISDPWDADLYDMVIPMDKTDADQAGALIKQGLLNETMRISDHSQQAVDDFRLAADVEIALVSAGHQAGVKAHKGVITLSINQQVLLLGRLEKELKAIIHDLPGVASVDTKTGSSPDDARPYRKFNLELPSKVLLVDDEQEFVQTLSERLQMREMGTVVAYDGASALSLVENDDPEVMIVDLKMPGMDGMDILSQVKEINPKIEVIILTGHGSEQDKEKCMALGAFAYMQKPADINTLSEILKQAHKKIRSEEQDTKWKR